MWVCRVHSGSGDAWPSAYKDVSLGCPGHVRLWSLSVHGRSAMGYLLAEAGRSGLDLSQLWASGTVRYQGVEHDECARCICSLLGWRLDMVGYSQGLPT